MSLSEPAFALHLYLSDKWNLLQMDLNQLSLSLTCKLRDPPRVCACVRDSDRGKQGVSDGAINVSIGLSTTLLIAGLN